MKLLLLWGDSMIADKTAVILRRHGYEVRIAESVQALPAELERFAPDLLLMEDELPGGNGFALCRELRERQERPWIILFSGEKDTEAVALQAGADAWMKVPYDMDVLLERMTALLRRRGAQTVSK